MVNEKAFDFVLVEEAGTVTEPGALVGVYYVESGKGRFCQCGDHKQLGPSCANHAMAEKGLGKSLFERLARRAYIPTTMLNIQYRYHPYLAAFPSEQWYQNQLQSGPKMCALPVVDSLCGWGNRRVLFLHTDAPEACGEYSSK